MTDDTQLVEAIGHPCCGRRGLALNLKITTAADLRLASAVLQALPKPKRDGPAHPFADEQAMWGKRPRSSRKTCSSSLSRRELNGSPLDRGPVRRVLPSLPVSSSLALEHRPERRLDGVGPDPVALAGTGGGSRA